MDDEGAATEARVSALALEMALTAAQCWAERWETHMAGLEARVEELEAGRDLDAEWNNRLAERVAVLEKALTERGDGREEGGSGGVETAAGGEEGER